MLQRIIEFSVKNKLIIGLFILAWVTFGIYQLSNLPIDAVPDITNNQVQVITIASALGAEDIERLVTFPVEQANSNIPDLKEIRSISRCGLSVVTIVFDSKTDIYWARQQISERLQQIEVPPGVDKPFLGPVTTGLGEIYQYIIKAEPGYEGSYTPTDLRTIQDWIVRRELLGTPGVAEVSSFGGQLKQYQVSIDPNKLKAFDIDITNVFDALETNNSNTGGAYIEKGPSVLYIKTEGLAGSISDIEQIVVKTTSNGIPILVKDIATVGIGSAVRYGALTYNDEGEVTGAVVMMLKGGNSSQIIKNVKEKIADIQKTLPKGVLIEPFLDRTKMVNNAINTVKHNLMEGALIVVFVLVIFLGSLRAGLIVASVIPLAMLFAVSMMNLFGVSGNLMSLGALDFGLIIDGAVIIVEAVMHHLHTMDKGNKTAITQQEMNEEVSTSASRMMNAAVFGQIIILIVYLPILSLKGIEGKMFRPMAETVAFAIADAFILSLTYVPMISSLFISKKLLTKPTLSDRAMMVIEQRYEALLRKTMRYRKTVVTLAVVMLAVAIFIFSRMGGEFIPQLEEGDFAVETRTLVGTNLTTTINSFSKAAGLLKDNFPEVEKVVTKIGSSEIPTDPMPIEAGDMIVVLKDKEEWTSAGSFPELADKMTEKLREIPGITTSFQFPVQMRFNELMTGAKQDVVCKIFGEDLSILSANAEKLAAIARTVNGTADMYVEQVQGLPQIVIHYNRAQIAKYGLDIATINKIVNAAFAGAASGAVYEGDRRFDLVVKMEAGQRQRIEDVQNLLVSTPMGIQVPLYQLATIAEEDGPVQVQRENTKRRILVGFNVRGRDVQSIVEELQQKVSQQIKLPPGYTIRYGGSFENLQEAKSRLSIAVPVALLLIFLMLYFAFNSFKEGLLIFSAIPLSAIGGVFALWMRGLPFSISAGVGFIALFGVAVLNGIVLISEFNRLQKKGISDIMELVIAGTKNRLRPVLMTASVASLGFLPMALSNGAGAEVQRPLATVVIGGLISATLLTLLVLPILYMVMEKVKLKKAVAPAVVVLLFFAMPAKAQTVSLQESLHMALNNNLSLNAQKMNEAYRKQLIGSSLDLPKTNVAFEYGQINSLFSDNRFTVSQSIDFPTVYMRKKQVLQQDYELTQATTNSQKAQLKANVKNTYYQLLILQERKALLQYADSIYALFQQRTDQRFKAGDVDVLEKTTAETQRQQIARQLLQLETDMQHTGLRFRMLLNSTEPVSPREDNIVYILTAIPDSSTLSQTPAIIAKQKELEQSRSMLQLEKSQLLPGFNFGYNNMSIAGYQTAADGTERFYNTSTRFSSALVGISIPIFAKAQISRIKAGKLYAKQKQLEKQALLQTTATELQNSINSYNRQQEMLTSYQQTTLPNAQTMIDAATLRLRDGEIGYLEWVVLMNQAFSIKAGYLDVVTQANESAVQIELLTDTAVNNE